MNSMMDRAVCLLLSFSLQALAFSQFSPRQVIHPGPTVTDIETGDMDLDGDLDLVIATTSAPNVGLLENLGNGQFAALVDITDNTVSQDDILVADLDMDGDLDVLSTYVSEHLFFYRNNGGGDFEQQLISVAVWDAPQIQVGDMDGDGDRDVVLNSHENWDAVGAPVWLENDGTYSGQWYTYHFIDTVAYSGMQPIKLFDADDDGDLDLLSGSAYIYRNDGTGAAFTREELEGGVGLGIDVGDIDGDHDVDIVCASLPGDRTVWIENLGSTFSPAQLIDSTLSSPEQPFLVDMDMDGRLDILLASSLYPLGDAIWYRNQGNGDFERIVIAKDIPYPSRVVACDLDGDGASDPIISTRYGDDEDLITMRSYCLLPFKLLGDVFWDEDLNGQRNPQEPGFSYAQVRTEPQLNYFVTGASGDFEARASQGSTTVRALPIDDLWELTTDSASFTVQTDPLDSTVTGLRFGFHGVIDTVLGHVAYATEPTRCGFLVDQWLTANNHGTVRMDGWMALTLDTLTTFASSTPTPDSVASGTIYWRVIDLPPYGAFQVTASVQMPGVDHMGETLTSTARLLAENGLGDPHVEDSLVLVGTLTAAYDPNDKRVTPGYGPQGAVDMDTEWLKYTIRFQNTGSDTAFNILIHDQLLPALLEPNSLQVLGASHELTMAQIEPDGGVFFRFMNILLPDSNTNEPDSHGSVVFRVALRPGLPAGTVVPNAAEIYFDFNPPIATDTIITTLRDCSSFTAAIIVQDWQTLSASGGALYQWHLDGSMITGATASTITPIQNGLYTVSIVSDLGCQATSTAFPFYSAGTNGLLHESGVLIRPNPAEDMARITLPPTFSTGGGLLLTDALGRQQRAWRAISSAEMTLNLDGLSAGFYVLRLEPEQGSTLSVPLVLR